MEAVLDHLTTGRDHPIARHINGIHSGAFRPQHAPINAIEQEAQKIVVAVVAAYAKSANVSQRVALKAIILAAAKGECHFTSDQIKGWKRKFRNDRGPAIWEAKLNEAPDVFGVGISWIWKWWGTPMPSPGD
jgi:hypothetical protein